MEIQREGGGIYCITHKLLISYSDHSMLPYLTGFRSGFWLHRTKKLIDPYYATHFSVCMLPKPLRISNPPKVTQFLVFFPGGRSGPNVVYTRPDESHLLCGKKPVIALGDILPRIAIVAVPSGLST